MNDPNAPQHKIDPLTGQGTYATGLAIVHTREEFMLDFINGIAVPPRVAKRVIVSPSQLRRILKVIQENINMYEKTFGPIPAQQKNTASKSEKAGDLYSKLQVADEILGGAYSNSMTIRHTRDIFIMDFMTNFPPSAKVVARLLISSPQIRSIIGAMEDNLSQYEKNFGKVEESAPVSDQPMGFSLN